MTIESQSSGAKPAPVTHHDLIAHARYELIPMKSAESQITHLPAGCSVSVTCSPAKGLAPTLELTARLADLGHLAVPHLSARLVTGPDHVRELAQWCRDHGTSEVFLVAGDAPEPVGPYDGVVAFLREFLGTDHGLTRIGVTAYPDGHALIEQRIVDEALFQKQQLLAMRAWPASPAPRCASISTSGSSGPWTSGPTG